MRHSAQGSAVEAEFKAGNDSEGDEAAEINVMHKSDDEDDESVEAKIESVSDSSASILYRFYRGTRAGNKYLCVVVKYATSDAYVLTAYPSDEVKKGRILWERNKK